MYRIKVIKRAALQSCAHASERETISRAVAKSPAGKVVERWIDERRASKPEDPRQAFAQLFRNFPAASD